MAINETTICNMALSLIDVEPITTYGDTDTKQGRMCKLWYEPVRDEVLCEPGIIFNCAKGRSGTLAAVSEQPSSGYDYAYQVPADCLKVDMLVDDSDTELTTDWIREGDYILTNEDEVYILYTKKVTNPVKFTPPIVECIYTKLAARLAKILTSNDALAKDLEMMYLQVALPKAMGFNQSEGYRDEVKDTWVEVGRDV